MMEQRDESAGAAAPGAGSPAKLPVEKSRLTRRLYVALSAIAGIILLFFGGFFFFANHISVLEPPKEIRAADAIIVLTGGRARLDAAMDLLQLGKGRRLFISGVNPHAGPKALSEATGIDEKLFTCCIDIDHAALNTEGNAEESAKWVHEHNYSRVIVVTNNYHMPRSLLEMHRLLGQTELIPYPVVNSRLDDGIWMTKPEAVRVLLTEYTKYVAALARSVVIDASYSPSAYARAGY
jgi:uncharacterized SAM-binding protein YcdF (DUF218 family)